MININKNNCCGNCSDDKFFDELKDFNVNDEGKKACACGGIYKGGQKDKKERNKGCSGHCKGNCKKGDLAKTPCSQVDDEAAIFIKEQSIEENAKKRNYHSLLPTSVQDALKQAVRDNMGSAQARVIAINDVMQRCLRQHGGYFRDDDQ